MRIVRGWSDLKAEDRGAAVAFGAFDGVHRGHEQVIAGAGRAAGELDAPLGVVSFEPDPWRWFHPDAASFLLTSPGQRARRLAELGVERFHILPFDQTLASLPAEQFVREVLVEGLGLTHIAMGSDLQFGRGRTGRPELLRAMGADLGFGVTVTPLMTDEHGRKLSSTSVRDALKAGDPKTAAAILGRPFAIEGMVVEGRRLGRELGFPTANVALGDYVQPRLGIYATRTRLPDGRVLGGVSSIGENPTVGLVEPRLEAWLFDFAEDIYGQVIETELIDFLRPEEKFDSLDALVRQVRADADQARLLLGAG